MDLKLIKNAKYEFDKKIKLLGGASVGGASVGGRIPELMMGGQCGELPELKMGGSNKKIDMQQLKKILRRYKS